MAYDAKIVLDSVSEAGDRLTTMEITFPRIVLAEFNTHRAFSRNSASSRAIPVKKQLRKLLSEPFVPERFGINEPGMQSFTFLDGLNHEEAVRIWLRGRDRAATTVFELLLGDKLSGDIFGYYPETSFATIERLSRNFDEAVSLFDAAVENELLEPIDILNVHKQLANRLLEPFMWQTVIVTATDWSNFFALRSNPDAQAEIRSVADKMKVLYGASAPSTLKADEWHLPYIQPEEADWARQNPEQAKQISAARCARVSYLTHDGKRDLDKDFELYVRLVSGGHMSPLEHPATPMCYEVETGVDLSESWDWVRRDRKTGEGPYFGNFFGWKQLRKFVPNEHDFSLVGKE